MSQSAFHIEAKAYIRKVLRTRKGIIKKGYSNIANAADVVNKLERQLNYWPYNTDETMARFITFYHNDIAYIIPGGCCRAGKTFLAELAEINYRSLQILTK